MRTVYNFVLNLPLKKLSTDRKVLKQIKKKKKLQRNKTNTKPTKHTTTAKEWLRDLGIFREREY